MQQMFKNAKMYGIDILDLSVCRTHENMRGWRVQMYQKLGFKVYYTGNQPDPFYQMARIDSTWMSSGDSVLLVCGRRGIQRVKQGRVQ